MAGHVTATRGFVAWALAWVSFVIFIAWSTMSDENMHRIGVHYYPQRYWAAAGPALVIVGLYGYLTVNWLMYVRNTRPLHDLCCLTDEHAKGSKSALGTLGDANAGESVAPISDIPASVTTRLFYLPWK